MSEKTTTLSVNEEANGACDVVLRIDRKMVLKKRYASPSYVGRSVARGSLQREIETALSEWRLKGLEK